MYCIRGVESCHGKEAVKQKNSISRKHFLELRVIEARVHDVQNTVTVSLIFLHCIFEDIAEIFGYLK